MSIQALAWALTQPISSHGAKLLLVALANYCDEQGRAWPSQQTLRQIVRADRKSIIRWIAQLREAGYLSVEVRPGTGVGRRTNLYRLQIDGKGQGPNQAQSHQGQSPNQTPLDQRQDPNAAPQAQSPNAATLRKVPTRPQAKSHPDPGKVPMGTHNPLSDPSEEPSEKTPPRPPSTVTTTRHKTGQRSVWKPPDWINPAAWAEFEQHRREIKKPLSTLARIKAANLLRDLNFAQQQQCIDQSIQARWAGLFPEKVKLHDKPQGPQPDRQERRRQVADALISRARRHFEPMD